VVTALSIDNSKKSFFGRLVLFLVVVVLRVDGLGVYWVISSFWGSCTVTSMLGVCFWVLVCWFPLQNRVQPIVHRMRIMGSRRRMSVRLRIRGSNL